MRVFKVLSFVSLFFFMIGCDEGAQRFVPIDEPDDASSETADDKDTPDTEVPDDSDSGTPADDSDNSDTPAPDDDDAETSDTEEPDTEEPDAETPDTEGPDTEEPDTEEPDAETPDTEGPDTDTPENICYSAVFNGTSSKISVPHSDALNLGHFWTIEAWIWQDFSDLPTKENYILSKGSRSYYLEGFNRSNEGTRIYYNTEGGFYYAMSQYIENDFTVDARYRNTASDSPVSDGWNHVALSYYIKSGKAHLRLYINGKLAGEETVSTNDRAPKTVEDALSIGYYAESGLGFGKESYFKGKIDQLKISNNYYEDEFTPSQLSVDDYTVALWDFSNNAEDSSENGLDGQEANITYSEDCAF